MKWKRSATWRTERGNRCGSRKKELADWNPCWRWAKMSPGEMLACVSMGISWGSHSVGYIATYLYIRLRFLASLAPSRQLLDGDLQKWSGTEVSTANTLLTHGWLGLKWYKEKQWTRKSTVSNCPQRGGVVVMWLCVLLSILNVLFQFLLAFWNGPSRNVNCT